MESCLPRDKISLQYCTARTRWHETRYTSEGAVGRTRRAAVAAAGARENLPDLCRPTVRPESGRPSWRVQAFLRSSALWRPSTDSWLHVRTERQRLGLVSGRAPARGARLAVRDAAPLAAARLCTFGDHRPSLQPRQRCVLARQAAPNRPPSLSSLCTAHCNAAPTRGKFARTM